MKRLASVFGAMSVAQKRKLLLIVLPAVGILIGGYFYIESLFYASTDDAYVKADKVYVAAEVSGRLVSLPVHEHERVKAGQLLLQLDDQPYKLALAAAEAHLAGVKSDLESLQAEYHQKQAELARAQSDIAYYQRAYDRNRRLAKPGFASATALDDAHHRLQDAKMTVQVVKRALAVVKAKLGTDPDQAVEQFSSYRQALADRDQAALRLQKTRVYAPMDGVIGPLDVQPGDYVMAGKALFPLVSTHHYVEAYLKETDLAKVRPGQHATVEIDAYPGRTWQAEVESISPATGSEFSLLPAENSSGNWVKVVQRVGVRLKITDPKGAPPLRSGLSVTVKISTFHAAPWSVADAQPAHTQSTQPARPAQSAQ
jgi:membrane fusion protein, multidrug efflux system